MVALVGPRVWREISEAAAACRNPASVAVAYFGAHGHHMLRVPPGSSIVVDASIPVVEAGSTCPAALSQLARRGIAIYSCESLHAKMYAFDNVAFVGSANASVHSSKRLIEAVVRVHSSNLIASIREFVHSLCLTSLSVADLKDLGRLYRPPRPAGLPPAQSKYSTLVMELTNEQGGGRETQVQPPKAVWKTYFGLTTGHARLPTLGLTRDVDGGSQLTRRQVVSHHHNFTIEIAGAEYPRPAILQMRRIARNNYWYRVHRPHDVTFNQLERLLQDVHNPHWHSGRRWILI